MGQKQIKKLRKEVRREVEKTTVSKIQQEVELWRKMIRTKPVYIPRGLWVWGGKFYFTRFGIRTIFRKK